MAKELVMVNLAVLAVVGFLSLWVWQMNAKQQSVRDALQDRLRDLAFAQASEDAKLKAGALAAKGQAHSDFQDLALLKLLDSSPQSEGTRLRGERDVTQEKLRQLATLQTSAAAESRRSHDELKAELRRARALLDGKRSQAAPSSSSDAVCPPIRFVRPFRKRQDLGFELKRLGLRGLGVEVGVQQGAYSHDLLQNWGIADTYVMVDLWAPQTNYKDSANVELKVQEDFMNRVQQIGELAQRNGWVRHFRLCRNFSTVCVHQFADESLDFAYIDARHDRKGVLEDMKAYWPKVKKGGVMAGHDYMEMKDFPAGADDWSLNYDGTRDTSGRVVKGAVDDFFSGVADESPAEFRRCPRQVAVTYCEGYNTWVVGK